MKTALTIAGSDSSGGAGIQADIKAFSALGVYGMSVITAVTAQNTCGVTNIRELDEEIVRDQIAAVFDDIQVNAVKIGMLANAGLTKTVAETLQKYGAANIVVDPVMISKSGSVLLRPEAIQALTEYLFPLASVVTPNLHEASRIVGFPVEDRAGMEAAAVVIKKMGPAYVVVKGGHLQGAPCDLVYDGTEFTVLANERIDTVHTHGTGCTFSSAVAAGLAKGMPVLDAVRMAKQYITMAIEHGFALGRGVGPTHHFYHLYQQAGFLD
ncbi:MAG: bifunctional hydroxymethylpyrimidine kinase/phosphomethylpyrimidine kinase [Negativicutes bacterium]|nr:bifunctional hydroxymethylpyrimidine kinase/phosphomethylpyrimidine kinase [Negativicutes bacterium]